MDIKLNDIFNLTNDEINNSKIGLNMGWGGKTHFSSWYDSDPEKRDVDFAYHSHYGKTANFKENKWCFAFVRLEENPDFWLFVSAGKILSVPSKQNEGVCKHEELTKYSPFVGR